MWLTWLADVLRGAGLTVIEEPGWQTRGYAAKSSPGGALVALTGGLAHHTATPNSLTGDYPTKKVILKGRPDVPPPLSQLGLGRGGGWYVFAAGRSNHSGAVDDVRYSNPQCVGVEAEHPGGSTPWPAHQYRSYVRGCAAIGLYAGITWRGHKEAAVPYGRKPDPNFNMDAFRAEVAAMQAELRAHGIAVQEALNAAGYTVTVDGKVGPETVAATRRAQQDLGLEMDGYPGPVTLATLTGTPAAPPTGGMGGGMSPIPTPPAPAPAPTPVPEEDDMFDNADRAKLDKTAYAVDKILLPAMGRTEKKMVELMAAVAALSKKLDGKA